MKRSLIVVPVTMLALFGCGANASPPAPALTTSAATTPPAASVREALTFDACNSIYVENVGKGVEWVAPDFDTYSLSTDKLEEITRSYQYDSEHVPANLEASFLAMKQPFQQILDARKAGTSLPRLDLGGLKAGGTTILTACQTVIDQARKDGTTPAPAGTPAAPAPASSNMIEEGTWAVGEDVKPGTYRTTTTIASGDGCYWEITKSGSNGRDIIANDNVTGGRPTVTLAKEQEFKTQGCGNWTRTK